MNYTEVAKQILILVGGSENVLEVTHCLTRLRLRIQDSSMVKKEEIEAIDGIRKLVERGNNIQIVIGEDVDDVYEAFNKIYVPGKASGEKVEKGSAENQKQPNILLRLVDTISGCIVPVLPALIACGLVSGLLSLAAAVGLLDSQSTTYSVLSAFGSAPLFFLPFLLAFSSARRLNVNPAITMAIAAVMLFPKLTALLGGEDPVTFFGILVKNVTYSQNLIPILLVVWVQSYIEPWLSKRIPKYLRTLFLPFTEYMILGILALLVLGPVAGFLNDVLYNLFFTLSKNYAWLVVSILGGLNAVRIGAGLNHSILPIAVANFSALGYDNIVGPAMFCTVFSLAGTCIGLGIRTKNTDLRQTAFSAAFTALMGISEPAVFSVMMPNMKSMIATSIAGLCGGFFMGIMHVSVNALGTKGLPGMALLIGPTFVAGCIGCLISFVLGIVLSYVLGETKK